MASKMSPETEIATQGSATKNVHISKYGPQTHPFNYHNQIQHKILHLIGYVRLLHVLTEFCYFASKTGEKGSKKEQVLTRT
jgi:hypothetical protein